MDKLLHEVMRDIQRIDPQNVAVKVQYTKVLIERGDMWSGITEYLRSRSLTEWGLSRDPENTSLLTMYSELDQLGYLVRIKLESMQGRCLMKIDGDGTNMTLGLGEHPPRLNSFVPLPELIHKKINSVACGDFHTMLVVSGCTCMRDDTLPCQGLYECCGGSDVMGFGYNIHGQVNGIPSEQAVTTPQIISHFIGKRVKMVTAT